MDSFYRQILYQQISQISQIFDFEKGVCLV